MSVNSNYTMYQQVQRNPIYQANNNNVSTETKDKQKLNGECKNLANCYVGAVKAPKASTLKKLKSTVTTWIENYNKKPHRYNPNKVERNINTALDIIDDAANPNHQQNSPSKKSDSKN